MPTLSSMQIPAPTSWDEFEQITLSALKIKWNSPNLTRNGRQGQPQSGVDIYGEDDLGRFVGVQCKLSSDELVIGIVCDEVKKAEAFEPRITAFYVATTQPHDAKLQKEIRLLSSARASDGKFPIGVFFWDDLIQELVKNEDEFSKHYPQIRLAARRSESERSRLLSLLDITYFGLHLASYMDLILGEIGWMTEDPREFRAVADIVDSCAMILFVSEVGEEIHELLGQLTDYAIHHEGKPERWAEARALTTVVGRKIATLEYGLTGTELAAFDAGSSLGGWNFAAVEEKALDQNLESAIRASISTLSPNGLVPEEINRKMEEFKRTHNSKISSVQVPHLVYSLVKSLIRYHEMRDS